MKQSAAKRVTPRAGFRNGRYPARSAPDTGVKRRSAGGSRGPAGTRKAMAPTRLCARGLNTLGFPGAPGESAAWTGCNRRANRAGYGGGSSRMNTGKAENAGASRGRPRRRRAKGPTGQAPRRARGLPSRNAASSRRMSPVTSPKTRRSPAFASAPRPRKKIARTLGCVPAWKSGNKPMESAGATQTAAAA